jgi:hypothetical protein
LRANVQNKGEAISDPGFLRRQRTIRSRSNLRFRSIDTVPE